MTDCCFGQVVVFGGGSFGTAMASALARQKQSLEVVMLMRDPYVCRDINHSHMNARYLQVGLRKKKKRKLNACRRKEIPFIEGIWWGSETHSMRTST